ncbi:MAG TPA: hypothetical protein VF188_03990 [Longimicrobiales bacterium]
MRLSSGVIAIADVYDAAVRFFDPAGRLIRKVGRRGGGPGEFQSPTWLGRCGADSVFVWDASLSRMAVIDPAGGMARMAQFPGSPTMVRCSRRGTFAAFMGQSNATRFGPERWAIRYASQLWLLDAQGDTIRSLGEMPLGEFRPLGRVTQLAMTDDRVYVGTADSASVDVYGLDGRRLTTLAVGIPARAPTRPDYERAIDVMVRPFPGRGDQQSMRRMLLEIPMPELMPPYFGLFGDPAGTLWVVTSGPAEPTMLRAIAPDGRILGDVRLPVALEVFEVGRDYILGAYQDESGEQHVAMYRLRRGA